MKYLVSIITLILFISASKKGRQWGMVYNERYKDNIILIPKGKHYYVKFFYKNENDSSYNYEGYLRVPPISNPYKYHPKMAFAINWYHEGVKDTSVKYMAIAYSKKWKLLDTLDLIYEHKGNNQ